MKISSIDQASLDRLDASVGASFVAGPNVHRAVVSDRTTGKNICHADDAEENIAASKAIAAASRAGNVHALHRSNKEHGDATTQHNQNTERFSPKAA